ncbi:MAG: NTP transferase domain-containing protein [Pseudomonadota bacterium]
MSRWTALLLAGARGPEDPVAKAAGVDFKAFAPVAGRPMMAWPLDALAGCGRVETIHVSLDPTAPDPPAPGVLRRASGASPAQSVLEAFEDLGPPLLVTTADHALLTPAMLDAFLDGVERRGADLCAGVARREVAERSGRGGRRTWIRFSDRALSGCNLFALRTSAAAGAVAFWRRMEALRKRPLAMAMQVGPWTLARYAAGAMSSTAAERALSRAFAARAALVELSDPDAAHDVDAPEDLAFAERRLRELSPR